MYTRHLHDVTIDRAGVWERWLGGEGGLVAGKVLVQRVRTDGEGGGMIGSPRCHLGSGALSRRV